MTTVLFLSSNKTYVLRAIKKKGIFFIKNIFEYESLVPLLVENNVDGIVEGLSYISEKVGGKFDKWYIGLPASVTSWKCELVSTLSDEITDSEAITEWALGYLDQQFNKSDYIPFIVSKSPSDIENTFFYTFAYTEKRLINILVDAFRKAELDLLYIEPSLASATRYMHKAFPVHEDTEVIFIDIQDCIILTNKFGTITIKTESTEFNYATTLGNVTMLLTQRDSSNKFGKYKPEQQIFTTSNVYLKEYLETTKNIPLICEIEPKEVITNYTFPIFCVGLLLKDLKNKNKRWCDFSGIKKLFE